MAGLEQPTYGARYQLVRSKSDVQTAEYKAHISLPTAQYEYLTSFSKETGLTSMEEQTRQPEDAPDPEAWVLKHFNFLCKQLYRNAKKGSWPRRIRQWKNTG